MLLLCISQVFHEIHRQRTICPKGGRSLAMLCLAMRSYNTPTTGVACRPTFGVAAAAASPVHRQGFVIFPYGKEQL